MNRTDEDCLQPEEIVGKYYQTLYSGDLKSLKGLMTEESYCMTLEPTVMGLSFKDPEFRTDWEKIKESKDTLPVVEKKISTELLSDHLLHQIDIKRVEPNGSKRKIVYYEEDGKQKRLYFSKKNGYWLIDYYAGRPASPLPQGYFSSMQKWVIFKLPSFLT